MSIINSYNKQQFIKTQSTKNTENTAKLKSFDFNKVRSNYQKKFIEQIIVENYLLNEDNYFTYRNKIEFTDFNEKNIPCVTFIPILSTTQAFNINTDKINFSYDWHLNNENYYVLYGMYVEQAIVPYESYVPIYFTLKMIVVPYYEDFNTEGQI